MNAISRRSMLAGSSAFAALAAVGHLPEARLVRAQGPAKYDIVDFGALTQGVQIPNGSRLLYGGFTDISSNGTTFGKIGVSGERFSPALWNPEGKLKKLKSGKYGGVVNALNANGDAVGQLFSEINGGDYTTINKPAVWISGDLTELPMPDPDFVDGGEKGGTATGISDDGVIVGDGNGHHLRWVNGSPEIIAAPDQTSIYSMYINASGSMASSLYSYNDESPLQKVARYDGSTFTTIDPPAGTEQFNHTAVGINGKNVILASVNTADVYIGVLYDGDKTTLLDLRESGGTFFPYGFNDKNDVVGFWQQHATDRGGPAVWSGDQPEDLRAQVPTSSGLELFSVQGISNDGVICGMASDKAFAMHPILLVPTA